jgi:hypothetical protein
MSSSNPRRDFLTGPSNAQLDAGAIGTLAADSSGRLVDLDGNVMGAPASFNSSGRLILPSGGVAGAPPANGEADVLRLAQGGARGTLALSCYFPLDDGTGATANGYPNDTPLTLAGGIGWGPQRGLNFNGAGYAQVDPSVSQTLLRSIFNLDSLTTSEMVMFYGVFTHGLSLTGTSTIFAWGRTAGSNPEGWGLEVTNALNMRFRHQGLGGSTTFIGLGMTNLNQSDASNNNTQTAIAGAVSRAANGDLELMIATRFLSNPGPPVAGLLPGGVNRTQVLTPLAKPGGASRSCRYVSDVSLTLGAFPGTGPASVNNIMPAGTALYGWGFDRRPRHPALLYRVVRELSQSTYIRPASANVIS